MIISSDCVAASTDSQKGCFPLNYIFYAVAFIVFCILLIGLLAIRQHIFVKAQNRDRDIDLEDQAFDPRLHLTREESADSLISLPPSYHTTDDVVVIPAPKEEPVPKYEVKPEELAGSSKGATKKGRPRLGIMIPSSPGVDAVAIAGSSPGAQVHPIEIANRHPMPQDWRDSLDLSREVRPGHGGDSSEIWG